MMSGFTAITFAAPWALFALVTLPLLWWLLRVMPPIARQMRFPAVRLLFGLAAREDTPAQTPWWVVLLRMILAALLILAVAHPLLHAAPPLSGNRPLLIVIDDGWAAARNWTERRAALDSLLDQAERAQIPVILLPTAPPVDGGPVVAGQLLPAAQARPIAQALTPKPWPVDRDAATAALRNLPRDLAPRAVWISDGVAGPRDNGFAAVLQGLGGGVEILTDPPAGLARLLLPPPAAGEMAPLVRRAPGGPEETVTVRALDGAGLVLARSEVRLAAQAQDGQARFDLPGELRNRTVRLDIENESSAAAAVLLDERWRRRPVGLVSGNPEQADAPLLSDLYYIDRALAPYAELSRGEIGDLLKQDRAVMILADVGDVADGDAEALKVWTERGGVLVRFAGPKLAQGGAAESGEGGTRDLLPVRLRGGGRALGGAMSWTEPMAVSAFPDNGPFAGLPVSPDLRVSHQVLAEPAIDLNDKTWARLADGTPLVTAEKRGKGWAVLVHTTANAEWSNLALSGVFVDMLRRLVDLAQGIAGSDKDGGQGPLPPIEVLDGFGRLTAPMGAASAIPSRDFAAAQPGPRHPPGFYGKDMSRRAFNLSPGIDKITPLGLPPGAKVSTLGQTQRELDLRPPLLAAALLLAILDTLLALAMRGLLRRRAAAVAAGLALLILTAAPDRAEAQPGDDDFALRATLETRLAYVKTGDPAQDDASRAGLSTLTHALAQRSTAELGLPMGVDIETDLLMFFPLLYWPVSDHAKPPTSGAQLKLNDFMRHGGMIVFDTGGNAAAEARLREVTAGLSLPPLAPVAEDHVLTRSFYLLKEMPGRFAGGQVWVEQGGAGGNDGVSPVVVGSQDWAAAWAASGAGGASYTVLQGGERQRELALRFGINLVMYALTGNYKADQVHIPAIMERLGR